ncbi:Panacea domain-containing protein [Caulobacter segnis]
MLSLAEDAGVAITNLALQKLVYFAHGLMIVRHDRPLVDGYFEAWEYGPVHPLLYGSFKSAGGTRLPH